MGSNEAMPKRGRPSEQRELIAARAALKADEERTLAMIQAALGKRGTLWDCVWLAATILNTFDERPDSPGAQRAVSSLRRTKWGMQVDPTQSLRPNHFAERFLQKFAPNWPWESQRDDGAHERTNEKLAQEHADMDRFANALRLRHATPHKAAAWLLDELRQIKGHDVATWPTLRHLKLATAMSERTIAQVVSQLKPNPGEVRVVSWRPVYQKRGHPPKRFAPRLVIGVIDFYMNDLENAPLDTQQKNALLASAARLKKSLAQKIRLSVSGT